MRLPCGGLRKRTPSPRRGNGQEWPCRLQCASLNNSKTVIARKTTRAELPTDAPPSRLALCPANLIRHRKPGAARSAGHRSPGAGRAQSRPQPEAGPLRVVRMQGDSPWCSTISPDSWKPKKWNLPRPRLDVSACKIPLLVHRYLAVLAPPEEQRPKRGKEACFHRHAVLRSCPDPSFGLFRSLPEIPSSYGPA